MPRIALHDATLIDPEAQPLERGALLVDASGRIEARLAAGATLPPDAERVDLGGLWLAPGFVDLHFHGSLVFADTAALPEALYADARSLVRFGTTAFLATTVAWDAARLAAHTTAIAAACAGAPPDAAAPIGIHLEGPWIHPDAAGAQPRAGIRPYAPAEGADVLARGAGLVRVVTLAPEIEGAAALLAELGRRGVVAALGHSVADAADVQAAVERGARHVTHLFNGMGRLHHRDPGLAGVALADDRLTCDLICDGVHVDPLVVRVAARAKRERLALVTDRIEPPPGGGSFGSGALRDDGVALRLPDGRLAGSRLTLDTAVRNAMRFAGMTLHQAVAACTLRPARILGMESERGTLRPGARADLVVLDSAAHVRETWIGGRRVYSARH